MRGFVSQLDPVFEVAESSPGFIWRRIEVDGENTGYDETYLVNVSVWQDVESLHNYVYKSAHVEVLRDRKKGSEKLN